MIISRRNYIPISAICVLVVAGAFAPLHSSRLLNLGHAYDADLIFQPWHVDKKKSKYVTLEVAGEHMASTCSYDENRNESSNPLALYGNSHSILAALEGHARGQQLHTLANSIRGMQDGRRGVFTVSGNVTATTITPSVRCHLKQAVIPGDFYLRFAVPVVQTDVTDVTWQSQTDTVLYQDVRTRDAFATSADINNFFSTHSGLSVGTVSHRSISDLSAQLHWQYTHHQHRNRLKNVMLFARCGLLAPVGKSKATNHLFAITPGHGGSWGIPFGLGLTLDLDGAFKVGVDVGSIVLSSRTQEWRLKTSREQSDFFVLKNGQATRELAPEWKFHLFAQTGKWVPGFTGTIGYQFYKIPDSTLYPQDDNFGFGIINSAEFIATHEAHNVFCSVTYRPLFQSIFSPTCQITCTIPVGGKRIMSGYCFAATLGLCF